MSRYFKTFLISVFMWQIFLQPDWFSLFKFDATLSLILIVNFFICWGNFCWVINGDTQHKLLAMFWIFNTVFLVLPAIALTQEESIWFVNRFISPVDIYRASYVLLCTFILSSISSFKLSKMPTLSSGSKYYGKSLSLARLRVISITYSLVFFAIALFDSQKIRSVLPDSLQKPDFVAADQSLSVIGIQRAVLIVTPMVLALLFRQEYTLSGSVSSRFLGSFFAFLSLVLSNPLGAPRQVFILGSLPIFGLYFFRNQGVYFYTMLFLPFLIVLTQPFSFLITHAFDQIRNGQRYNTQDLFMSGLTPLTRGDFDAFGMFALGLRNLLDDGLESTAFKQFTGVLFFWIPRSIWPSKPFGTSVYVAKFNNFSFENLSAPWVLELVLNGGIILLFIGAILLPLLFLKIDRSATNNDLRMIQSLIVFASLLILLRGSLLQASGVFVYSLCLCTIAYRKKLAN